MGNKRIAVNTFFTIGQSLIATLCGLFSGRWILNALGQEGYGAFSVVGGLMAFILFFNSVLTASASRHFSYAIGECAEFSQEARTKYLGDWFSASFCAHVVMSLGLCLVGEVFGEWYIANKLVVAEELRSQCFWVFRLALASAFFAIVSAPYFALYAARQLIFVRTMFSLGATILATIGAYALFYFPSQRLFFHSLITVSIHILTTLLIVVFAMARFPETKRLSIRVKMDYLKALFAFGSAQMFGIFANMLRDQGISIVINWFSGARSNAGWGIGRHVSGKTSLLATASMGAILPEITTCLSSNRRDRAFNIAEKVNLFVPSSYAVVISPVLFNLCPILKLWLGDVPFHAVEFCGIILFFMYIDALTGGYQQLINANGKIMAYQISMSIAVAASVPVAVLLCKLDAPIVFAIGFGILATTALTIPIRLFFMKRLFLISILRQWFRRIFVPNLVCFFVSFVVCRFVRLQIGQGVGVFVLSALASGFAVVLTLYATTIRIDREFMMRCVVRLISRGRYLLRSVE